MRFLRTVKLAYLSFFFHDEYFFKKHTIRNTYSPRYAWHGTAIHLQHGACSIFLKYTHLAYFTHCICSFKGN